MTKAQTFIVDQLAGVVPGSAIDQTLSARGTFRQDLQDGYDRLFRPVFCGTVSLLERCAVATFVAVIRGDPESSAHFQALLRQADPSKGRVSRVVLAQAQSASRIGPYGIPLDGPPHAGDLDGPVYTASADVREVLGDRLAAALEFAHLMALHPADETADSRPALLKSGWSDRDIALLAELVSFLGLHLRLVAGLRALTSAKETSGDAPPAPGIAGFRLPVRPQRPARVAHPGIEWFQYGC
jgi:CMD domain protein